MRCSGRPSVTGASVENGVPSLTGQVAPPELSRTVRTATVAPRGGGNVWRQFLLSQLGAGWGCYRHQVARDAAKYTTERGMVSPTRGSWGPNVLSVKAETLWAGTWALQGSFRVRAPGTVVNQTGSQTDPDVGRERGCADSRDPSALKRPGRVGWGGWARAVLHGPHPGPR